MTIPKIGVLNATVLIAAIGQGENFARGRELAAWLSLVPRRATTGGKLRLLGISHRQHVSAQAFGPWCLNRLGKAA